MGTYIVKPGDTLTAIAKSIRGDPEGWRDIAASNALKNPNRLQVGQVLEIDDYEPEQAEGIPEPTLNPRRDYSQSRGNAFGPRPPVELVSPQLPSPRAAGAEEMAIPDEPELVDNPVEEANENRVAARTDLTPELLARLRERQGVGPFPARPGEVAPNTPVSNPVYNDPSRRADIVPELRSEPAYDDPSRKEDWEISHARPPQRPDVTPTFDWAAAGAEFDPPTGAKIAEMMKRFKDRPELVDQVLQQMMEADEAAQGNGTTQ